MAELQYVVTLYSDVDLYDEYKVEPSNITNIHWRMYYMLLSQMVEKKGLTVIDEMNMELHMDSQKDQLKKMYENAGGWNTIEEGKEILELENIESYYREVLRYSAILKLHDSGFDIESNWEEYSKLTYDELGDVVSGTVDSIFSDIGMGEDKVLDIKSDVWEMVKDAHKGVNRGLPLSSKALNSVVNGQVLGNITMVGGQSGMGKAQPVDTVIPTPTGDREMGDLKVGDYVFDRQGNPTKILGVFPQGKLEAYEVSLEDGRKTVCNDEHLWSYHTGSHLELETKTLREMMDIGIADYKTGQYNFAIPNNGAVKLDGVPIGVVEELLGFFVGTYEGTNQPKTTYYTGLNHRANLMLHMYRSLGYKATVEYGEFKRTGEKGYLVKATMPDRIDIVGVEKLEDKMEMVCISVDNDEHLYLTNDFIVTHNTFTTLNQTLPSAIKEKEPLLIMCNEEDIDKWQREILTWVINNKLGGNFVKSRFYQGAFTKQEMEMLREATDWVEENLDDDLIQFVNFNQFSMDKSIRLIRKYATQYGIKYFIIDTLKLDNDVGSVITDNSWLQLQQNMVKLYNVIKPTSKNVHVWVTYQLNKSQKTRYLDQSALGMSKNVADVVSTLILIRDVLESEKGGDANAIAVKRADGAQVQLSEEKDYMVVFIDKNRQGSTNMQVVWRVDKGRNIIKDVGFTRISQDY